MKAIDETGTRFGRLVAIRRIPSQGRKSHWLFMCDCGATKEAKIDLVKSGFIRSCGCLRRDVTAERSTTHGHNKGRTASREIKSWQHAKSRCNNPDDPKYEAYGGRGITMCGSWSDSFAVFFEYMGRCPEGMTLDRIDVNGNYEPGNCRWATAATQARNRRDNVWVQTESGPMILKDFSVSHGVNYKALHYRVRRLGQDPAVAVAEMTNKA